MKALQLISVATASTLLLVIHAFAAEPIVHFDNLDVPGDNGAVGTFKPLPAPAPAYSQAMAQTFVATGENVSEVTLGFGRFGTPGGKFIFGVREVDGVTNTPGEEIGVLGELIVDDVPQNENDDCAQPTQLPTVTVNGFVDGLVPGETYFLHIIESLEDKPTVTNFGTGPCGFLERGYSIDLVPNGGTEQIGEGGTHLFDWPEPPQRQEGQWARFLFAPPGDLSIRMRIAGAPQPVTHFDNLDVPGDSGAVGTFKPLPAPAPNHPQAMAQTFVATGENVSEVTLGFGRFGTPGGKLIFSIREVDGANDEPGEEIGVLGELIVDDVPQNENDVCSQPKKLPTVTVNGFVDGLVPGETYFLHIIESSEDKPTLTNFGTGPCGILERGYTIDLVPNGAAEQIGEGGTHLLDWPYPPDGVLPGEWQQWPEPNRHHLSIRVRIAGMATPEPLTDPFIIAETEEGSLTKVPDLDEYPIGSTVTVTATPEPGFEFVQWEYGDMSSTDNPAEITVEEGLTLTPRFAPAELDPIDVEILPAMAIRWQSQLGQAYEVQSSPDLQTWTSEAADVEGTGEQMTHFLIRDAREMYYRVLDNQ